MLKLSFSTASIPSAFIYVLKSLTLSYKLRSAPKQPELHAYLASVGVETVNDNLRTLE